jgi:hypothetical protein
MQGNFNDIKVYVTIYETSHIFPNGCYIIFSIFFAMFSYINFLSNYFISHVVS